MFINYWIGVVSKEHVDLAVKDGFSQVGHGKKASLSRMKKGDYLIYYSPKLSMQTKEAYQAFTALGQLTDDTVYQVNMNESFHPFRKDMDYLPIVRECPIDYARQHPEWKQYASQLHYGIFPVSREFFNYIGKYMIGRDG